MRVADVMKAMLLKKFICLFDDEEAGKISSSYFTVIDK